jgi:hypothetical protein
MSGMGRSIRFAVFTALAGLVGGYRHARRHEDPVLRVADELKGKKPKEGPRPQPDPSPTPVKPPIPAPGWFCDFASSMQSVLTAHYNGFVSGCAWALSHPESFERLRVAHSLTDDRFVAMAKTFAERLTDQVAATAITGERGALPDPASFVDLDLE